MKRIGGNTTAVVQWKAPAERNEICERQSVWVDAVSLTGWLDLSGGDAKRTVYNAKIQESTHLFLCDYRPLTFATSSEETVALTSENARILINGESYDIMLIDDPMWMHQHYEIYLKFTGGQNG